MSLAALHILRKLSADRETTLLNGSLVYPAYFQEPPMSREEEFIIQTALDLEYLGRFLETYPEERTDELDRIAQGEVLPKLRKVVEVLELIDECLQRHYPDSPWSRYPETEPEGEEVWIYDENGIDVVREGIFATAPTGHYAPYPFRDEKGEPYLTTHWAPRKPGQTAPAPPPII